MPLPLCDLRVLSRPWPRSRYANNIPRAAGGAGKLRKEPRQSRPFRVRDRRRGCW